MGRSEDIDVGDWEAMRPPKSANGADILLDALEPVRRVRSSSSPGEMGDENCLVSLLSLPVRLDSPVKLPNPRRSRRPVQM